MSQGDHVKISSKLEVEAKFAHLMKRANDWEYKTPLCIRLEPWVDPRTLNQLAIFHIWCRQLSQRFIKTTPDATEEGVKWMMKHKFLESKTIKVGKTVLADQIKSTSKLTKGEMCHFLDQVYGWAAERDVYLSLPEYNEYTELKRKQDK